MDSLTAEQQEQIVEKENEYLNYIIEHVQNVKKAAEEVIEKLHLSDELADQLRGRVVYHDQSKYSDEEFDAYRAHFHSISEEEKKESKEAFEIAWEHHYRTNTHHWNHYYNKETGTATEMPNIDIVEMLADWLGMCYKFEGTVHDWYWGELEKDPQAIVLHPNTKRKVEKSLEILG